MASKKKLTVIAEADLPRVFDDACIAMLASFGKLPAEADLARFAAGIREAALIYIRDAWRRTVGTVRDEIDALHDAAQRADYERTRSLLEGLSPQAHAHLNKRLPLPGPQGAGLRKPTDEEFLDPERRDEACDMIKRLCHRGGSYIEGRMRPSGKRSTTWQPTLYAPVPNEHPPKRDAERRFVINLQSVWHEAVGKPPTATVNPSRSDRPFANLVRACLELVGARADAVGLINEVHRRKLDERRRLAAQRRRQRHEASEAKKPS